MNTLIVCATKEQDPIKTLLYESLKPLKEMGIKFHAEFYTSNSKGLSKVYNDTIYGDTSKKGTVYDCYMFVHDDVYIDDAFVFDKIEDSFQEYDILGVAGASNPEIKSPALWHLMTKKEEWRGAAGHFSPDNSQIAITSFGPMPAKVDILDGVFLAVNAEKIIKAGWKFNENYTFHHYDIASTIDAKKKGLRCGVVPIHIIHKSPGLRDINDPLFQESQRKFLQEYRA